MSVNLPAGFRHDLVTDAYLCYQSGVYRDLTPKQTSVLQCYEDFVQKTTSTSLEVFNSLQILWAAACQE